MHKLSYLFIENRLCSDLRSKDSIIAEGFLRPRIHKGLFADFLPDVRILLVFGFGRLQGLYPDRHVDFAFNHLSCFCLVNI